MENKKIGILFGGALIIGISTYFLFFRETSLFLTSTESTSTPTVTESQTPKKIDFGKIIPADFPSTIPVEANAKISQSYSIDYEGQKQITVVFSSLSTVEKNYAEYSGILKDNNWRIINEYQSKNLSSLYGTMDSNEINITISEKVSPTSKSELSISFLKKQ